MQAKKGEHPLGDAGQLILFGVFLITWILDSFVLRCSTFMEAKFGQAYTAYRLNTGRWLPRFGKKG